MHSLRNASGLVGIALLAAAAACSGGSAGNGAGGGGGGDDDGGTASSEGGGGGGDDGGSKQDGSKPACQFTGFAGSSVDLPLPDVGATGTNAPFYSLSGGDTLSSGVILTHWTVDFDGDGKLDLLVTHKDDEVALGASKWRLYKGTGTGFSAPIDLPLPNVGATGSNAPFYSLSGGDTLSSGVILTHWTVDFDGDGKLDLLVTHKDNEVALGASKWRVYKGTGSGFGAPIDLALPTVGATGSYTPFASLSGEDNLTDGASLTHWTVDVDGDGKLDILATHKDGEAALGASKWRLYKGTGTGFAAPIDVALPSVGATGSYTPFASLSGEDNLTDGASLTHWTVDVDGDGKLDILATHKDGEAALGASKWRFYKGTGTGFGAPVDLALPNVGATGSYTPFASLGGGDNLTNGAILTHWTVDVDGDRALDLLATHKDGDTALGASKWIVFRATCQ